MKCRFSEDDLIAFELRIEEEGGLDATDANDLIEEMRDLREELEMLGVDLRPIQPAITELEGGVEE